MKKTKRWAGVMQGFHYTVIDKPDVFGDGPLALVSWTKELGGYLRRQLRDEYENNNAGLFRVVVTPIVRRAGKGRTR